MSKVTADAHNSLCRAVKEYNDAVGIASWKIGVAPVPLKDGGFRPAPTTGISDIIGLTPVGTFLAAEQKTGTGKLSENQKVFLDRVRKNGGHTIVVRDIADYINFVNEIREHEGW